MPRLALALALLLAGCKVDLYTKLREQEAVAMSAILMRHGIDADRIVAKDGSSTVQVDKASVPAAVMLLRDNGYPRETFATMGDVFAQQGLVSSPTEERARFIYALSQELSRTVSGIDGVLSARIHIVLPRNDPLRADNALAAASVFIRHDSQAAVGDILPQIKMMVANSVEGLSYEKVSVVLLPVQRAVAEGGHLGEARPGPDALLLGGAGAGALALLGAGLFGWRWRRSRAAQRQAPAPAPARRPPLRATA